MNDSCMATGMLSPQYVRHARVTLLMYIRTYMARYMHCQQVAAALSEVIQ